jgi:uncharacterized membrane protein YedE/YeeE
MSTAATSLGTLVIGGGFAVAFAFGLVAAKTNFCTMGALSDIVNMGHWGRMRMWMLTVAVAIIGTTALSASGLVDLAKSVPQRPVLPWLSLLVGGLVFGVGMTLSGGCANKNLVRVGGGSLRALVVLVFLAIASYMTLKGLFGQWRAGLLDPINLNLGERGWGDQSLATALAKLTGLPARTALWSCAAMLSLAPWRLCLQGQALPWQRAADRWRRAAGPAGGGGLVRHRPPGLMARTPTRWKRSTSRPIPARWNR